MMMTVMLKMISSGVVGVRVGVVRFPDYHEFPK